MSVQETGTHQYSRCAFCNRPVEADDVETYHEVIAWAHGPKMDSPVLRQQTGQLACKNCINKMKQGQAPDQEGLEL